MQRREVDYAAAQFNHVVHVVFEAAVIGADVFVVHVDDAVFVLFKHRYRIAAAHPNLRRIGCEVEVLRIGHLHQQVDLPRIFNQPADVGMNRRLDAIVVPGNLADRIPRRRRVGDGLAFVLHIRRRRTIDQPVAAESLQVTEEAVAVLQQTAALGYEMKLIAPIDGGYTQLVLGQKLFEFAHVLVVDRKVARGERLHSVEAGGGDIGHNFRPVQIPVAGLHAPGNGAQTPLNVWLRRHRQRRRGR